MEELNRQTNLLLLRLENEATFDGGVTMEQQTLLTQVRGNLDQLQALNDAQQSPAWNLKIQLLNAKFEQYGKMHAAAMKRLDADRKRAELLTTISPNNMQRSNMDETIYTADQLDRSIDATNSIFSSGRDTLARLAEQNETIRGTMGRAQDVSAALGLSRSTMRTIERHVRTDRWLVCGAIAFLIVFFVLLFMLL